MEKILTKLALLALVMVALASCNTTAKVAFKEANNYFTRNDYAKTGVVKIVSQEEFDGALAWQPRWVRMAAQHRLISIRNLLWQNCLLRLMLTQE